MALIYRMKRSGAGGLPVGTSGKANAYLGIDSPVAGYFAMKREWKLKLFILLVRRIQANNCKSKRSNSQTSTLCGNDPFYRSAIYRDSRRNQKSVPQGYWMTITRRMMLRLTDEIRRIRHGLVILNGESLGQVVSQTFAKYGGYQ